MDVHGPALRCCAPVHQLVSRRILIFGKCLLILLAEIYSE